MTVASPIPAVISGRTRSVPPRAGAMIEALRGLGYSTATALADIIDNSISAGASRVDLQFHWADDHSHIMILDNGRGMSDEALERAMRLGDRNPLEKRSAADLGRFGLGLKTASFSQCRRLTVASRQGGEVACLRWDLDVLAAADDDAWHLLEGPAEGSETLLGALPSEGSGTLILWENLDRIVGPGFRSPDFLNLIDQVEQHLAMVFHRLLEGPRPAFRLFINGDDNPVRPWDPFLTGFAGTMSLPADQLNGEGGMIEVQPHVLPHKDRLTPQEYERAGGPEGWTAQQGFYIYRNRRLLVAGGWLGLGQGRAWTREEAHRLARIRLDIPNTADAAWKIDIRKSTARPPAGLRIQLTRLAEDVRSRARQVFAHRSKPMRNSGGGEPAQAWRAEHFSGGMRYRIDETHPAVQSVLEDAGQLRPAIQAMLKVIEATVPVQRIWLDTAENRDTPRTGFAGDPPAEVREVLLVLFRNLVRRKGLTEEAARRQLLNTEPFQDYPELVAGLAGASTDER